MNGALAATFADFRLVKGRKVAQLILEIPIEQAEEAVTLFGMPIPDKERWVGIAPLVGNPHDRPASPPAEQAAPPRARDETASYRDDYLPRERVKPTGWAADRERAVMLCKDTRFQAWCGRADEEGTIETLRYRIGGSRSLIATDPEVHAAFMTLETEYRVDCGLMAARR